MWKPNRNNRTPLYSQIADHLKQSILLGEFPPGSLLPSERKLAEQLKVNRSTVVLAYSELRSYGLIESLPGSGTLVSPVGQAPMFKYAPDWNQYAEGGSFLPNLPFLRRIREAVEQDDTIIDFASGKLSVDLAPMAEVNRLIKKLEYSAEEGFDKPQGFLPLRRAMVDFLRQYRGIDTTESSILITTGSQQSLYLITQCLLSPGDAVGVECPSFFRSLSMFKSAGLKLVSLPVDEHGVIPEDLRRLQQKHRIKMLFVHPNFQNPTGTLLQADRRKELLDTAGELGLPIVEDDPHSLTALDGPPPPALKTTDKASNILYIGSLSKIAAAGLRVGWIVAPRSVIQRLADARRQMDLGFSVIPQKIAAQFIGSPDLAPHLERLRNSLRHKRDLLAAALQRELPGLVRFTVPEGGLHLWCRIIPQVQDNRLLEEALQRGVAFVPGRVYGADEGYMRLSFARPQAEEIAAGTARLAAALRAATAIGK